MSDSSRYDDIIGQESVLERLRTFGNFHVSIGSHPGHILLAGEEGMGLTTIGTAFAFEHCACLQIVSASSLQVPADLTAIVANVRPNQVVLLRNLQALRKMHIEKLQEVLREGKLSIIIGSGPAARTHVIEVKPFTLIATCPQKADCPQELLAQFSLTLDLQPYSVSELDALAIRLARKAGVELDSAAAALLVRHCDGRPRGLQILMKRFVRAINKTTITAEEITQALIAFGMEGPSHGQALSATDLMNISGVDFEKMVALLLDRMGFRTEATKASGDGGIDIIAKLDKPFIGGRYLFQCKRFAPGSLVGAPTLRDFYGAVMADRAIKGVFITTSDFTAQAREFGTKVGLELIALPQLRLLFLEHGMMDLHG